MQTLKINLLAKSEKNPDGLLELRFFSSMIKQADLALSQQ